MRCFSRPGEKMWLKQIKPVPVLFTMIFIIGLYYSDMSFPFVLNETITRFSRDGILVLSLILPIAAGMGINFAITVGALCAQVGLLVAIILQIDGAIGFSLAVIIGIGLSMAVGYLIGRGLNRIKGKEMIATILIGMLINAFYQFIFMVGYGRFIPALNQEIVLSNGYGVRNMVDLAPFKYMLDQLWVVRIGDIRIPLFMIMIVLLACVVVAYLLNTPLGQRLKAVGQDREKAALLGINVNRTRITAILLSTVIACIGQLVFLQNIGSLNVYTAQGNSDIISAAAILAGGATIKKASVRNAIIGIFLFHSVFIVSPQAGQNLFGNAALGEYFRSFVVYGTIALALIVNIRQKRQESKMKIVNSIEQ
ncbi:MAG: ABC transporter permease [Dehalococcoidales bacterium]|nr:ABC transporter permease [Dehalococcoidales bacterium]